MNFLHKIISSTVLACSVLLCSSERSTADEGGPRAILPYGPLWGLAYNHTLPAHAEVRISYMMRKSGEKFPPKGLVARVVHGNESLELEIDKDGLFTMPDKPEWAKGEALLVTNQPKGSMWIGMELWLSAKGGDQDSSYEDYRQLMTYAHFVRLKVNSMEKLAGMKIPDEALSAHVVFSELEKEGVVVTIHSKKNKLELKRNKDGVVVVPYSKELFEENPKIDFPESSFSLTIQVKPMD